MNLISSLRLLPLLLAGSLLAAPASGLADDHSRGGSHGGGDRGRGGDRFHGGGDRGWRGGYRGRGGWGYGGYGYGWGPSFYWGPGFGGAYYDGDYDRGYYGDGPVYRGIPRSPVSDDLIVDVQRELRHRGYYKGPIDGQPGPGTRAALRAYQADKHFPVTGRIDGRVIQSMGLN